jgi:hypothetical protein
MTANQADEGAKEIQTKYDEFQNACKTVLPKVDRKLIQEFLFRQQEEDSDGKPRYTVEVHTREGLDTKKIKELIWSKLGEMPDIDCHGTQYKFDHTLTLGVLKRISDLDYVLRVKGSYIGPV